MKSRKAKRVLAAVLASTMVMASALTVCASGTGTDTGYENTGSDTSGSGSSSSSSSSSSSESGSTVAPATYAEQMSQSANATITVGGTAVRTSIAGVYAAKTVQGCAVTASASDVAAALGLGSGQKAAIIIYDLDQKKSNMAMASVNAAIDAMGGGSMAAVLSIDLGARQGGKWVTLSSGSVGMKTGLPKGADTTKTYSVVCVQPGGAVTILEDQDMDPKTVTFAVQAGLGAYALVAK